MTAIQLRFSELAGLLEAQVPGITPSLLTQKPPTVELAFADKTPQDLMDAAQALVDGWDWQTREPRDLVEIAADIQRLSPDDAAKLQLFKDAQFLRDNPKFARSLNIPIDGDQPAAVSAVAPLP